MDLIIGAGVTGISYACFSNHVCKILEATDSPGGYCKTIKRNGYIWDYSGHFFHFQHPEIRDFVLKNLDRRDLLEVEKHSQILYKDKYIDFPFQKNIHQLDKVEFIDCLYDLFHPLESNNITSFKEMLYSNLGKSISEKFLIPYNEKLYACDLNNLDVNAMGRFFPKATPMEIIDNFKNSENASYNSYFTYPKEGAIQYINSLLKNLDNEILYNILIDKIDIHNKVAYSQDGKMYEYDNLISTVPFPFLLNIIGINYPKELFSWNKVLVYNMGFDKKGWDKKNNWIYIPSKEYSFYRIGYYDNIINSDKLSLYIEIGFNEKDSIPDIVEFKDVILRDLKDAAIIDDTFKLIDYEAILMNPAYVHITQKSLKAVKEYKEYLEQNDIYSIGRYGSWTYCSIEDNIIEARDLALKLNGRIT